MGPRMRFDWWGANDRDEYIEIGKDMVTDVWNQHYKEKKKGQLNWMSIQNSR